jgi:excisionase family DNA binding protein
LEANGNNENRSNDDAPEYLKTSEVARMLHVSPKTVSRWAKEDKIPHVRTLGGHRRFPARDIRELAGRLGGNAS